MEMIHALFGFLQNDVAEDAQVKVSDRRADDRVPERPQSDPADIQQRAAMVEERQCAGRIPQSLKEGGACCGSEPNEEFGLGPSSNTM
jgi:hypothetical protein